MNNPAGLTPGERISVIENDIKSKDYAWGVRKLEAFQKTKSDRGYVYDINNLIPKAETITRRKLEELEAVGCKDTYSRVFHGAMRALSQEAGLRS